MNIRDSQLAPNIIQNSILIKLNPVFNTLSGKKRETNTEVVYAEPRDYYGLEPRKSKDYGGRKIIIQEYPANVRNPPREMDIETEECRAYGKVQTASNK